MSIPAIAAGSKSELDGSKSEAGGGKSLRDGRKSHVESSKLEDTSIKLQDDAIKLHGAAIKLEGDVIKLEQSVGNAQRRPSDLHEILVHEVAGHSLFYLTTPPKPERADRRREVAGRRAGVPPARAGRLARRCFAIAAGQDARPEQARTIAIQLHFTSLPKSTEVNA